MSLFGSLFGQQPGGKQSSSLFSSNVYKQTSAIQPPQEPSAPSTASQQGEQQEHATPSGKTSVKKKKRKLMEAVHEGAKAESAKREKKAGRTHVNPAAAAAAAVAAAATGSSADEDEKQLVGEKQHKKKHASTSAKAAVAAAAAAAQQAKALEAKSNGSRDDSGSEEHRDDGGGDADHEAATAAAAAAGIEHKQKLSLEEQAQQLERTVFVGNVPAKTALKTLKAFFSKYGEVASARLRSVPVDLKSKMPRRAAIMKNMVDDSRAPAVAYVVFKDEVSVQAALAANMTELGGNHLRVDRAAPPAKAAATAAPTAAQSGHQFDTGRSLFVGNLHFATLDEELIQFFTCPEALEGNPELSPSANGGQPAIEGVRIVRDPATNLNKGFGFVLFRTKAAVRAALSLNGRALRKRPLRLTRVSVQQQHKLQAQRASAAASASAAKASKLKGQQQQQQRGAGIGGLHRTSGGGVHKSAGMSTAGADPALWQGTQIKGKAKGVRGTKALRQQRPSGKQSGGQPVGTKHSGKRPAVAARKKKQLASKAQQAHKN